MAQIVLKLETLETLAAVVLVVLWLRAWQPSKMIYTCSAATLLYAQLSLLAMVAALTNPTHSPVKRPFLTSLILIP